MGLTAMEFARYIHLSHRMNPTEVNKHRYCRICQVLHQHCLYVGTDSRDKINLDSSTKLNMTHVNMFTHIIQ